MKLDREWLISLATNEFTVKKIDEIMELQKYIETTNKFPEGNAPFFLSLGELNLKFFPRSVVASLEIYQEIFRDNDHCLLPDFEGKDTSIIFDVGANEGFYALRTKLKNPNCTVYCFEPNPVEFGTLIENVAYNRIKGIEAVNSAVGESDKEITFEYLPSVGAISGRGVREISRHWMREEFISVCQVNQMSLDTFCRTHDIPHIDILKIDTEGMEMEVLSGSRNILLYCERVVIERHSRELRDAVVNFMEAVGFDLVHEDDELLSRYYADIYFRNRSIIG